MSFRPEEVSAILQKELEGYKSELEVASIGTVLQVGDGIARVWGLDRRDGGRADQVPARRDGNGPEPRRGQRRRRPLRQRRGRQGRRPGAPHREGRACAGRDRPSWGASSRRSGEPLDGKGPIVTDIYYPLEGKVPNVVQRQPVNEPVQTGIKAIDSMIPIGRGQRELIIGDRQTGQDGDRGRHDHQPEGEEPLLHLRRDRAEGIVRGARRGDPRGARRDGVHDGRLRDRLHPGAAAVHRPLRGRRDRRVLPRQQAPRPLHLRRPLEARRGLPAAFAAAAPAAGPRGVSRATSSICTAGFSSARRSSRTNSARGPSRRFRSSRPRRATSRPTSRPT